MTPERAVRCVALLLGFTSCQKGLAVDWNAAENFFVTEISEKTDEGMRLEFHSLVDAPAADVYRALAEPERYAEFVEGVQDSGIISAQGSAKVTHITQTVIGRQNRAKVQWTLHPKEMELKFRTLESDGNFNDGEQRVIPSPDGKRCYVISIYHVKEQGSKAPIGVLTTATREAFEKAATSVKRRALGVTVKTSQPTAGLTENRPRGYLLRVLNTSTVTV